MPNQVALAEEESIREMQDVVELHFRGETPKAISDRLGIPFARVKRHLKEWREAAQNHPAIRARAKEALVNADEHYASLIKEAWAVLADLNTDLDSPVPKSAAARIQAVRAIADIEAKRVDMLHRSGLLENDELAEELLERERKEQIMIDILRDVVMPCDHCRLEVARRLSELNGETEVIQTTNGPRL